jgi:uncharacterized protein YxjI
MHEWAKAWRHLEYAIIHIERAKLKMRFRAERFPGKRDWYLDAITWNDNIVKTLRSIQKDLLAMIDEYGIKQGKRYNKTLQKLLTPPKLQSPEEWARKN